MQIEDVEIKELKPYERNAKKHDDKQIANVMESIRQFGFAQPLVVDKDNVLIIGHCRLIAAKRLKMNTVPVIRMENLTEDQVAKLRLLDNKLNESEWDMDLLLEDIPTLDFSDFDIDWELPVLEEPIEIIEDEAPEPDLVNDPITKTGDIWILGEHRVACGDSTDPAVILKLMNNQKAQMAFTSPPYNVGKNSTLNGNTHMKDSKYLGSDDDIQDWLELLSSTTNNMLDNADYAFINLQMLANNKIELIKWLEQNKEYLCDIAIWYKNSTAPAMAEKVMNSQYEFIFIFSKNSNTRAIGTKQFRGTVSNVYQGSAQRKNEFAEIHAATFPVEFVSHYVQNFTNEQEAVLDVFGGTGTTLIACEQLKRKCCICEIDPRYVDVIVKRWEKFTGKKAVRIE